MTSTTEFHDIMVKKGLLPNNEVELTEDQIIQTVESVVSSKMADQANKYSDKIIDQLDDMSADEDDEKIFLEYRRKRIAEIKDQMSKPTFGDVREISGDNYVHEVNKAGNGVWVLVLLYETSSEISQLLQEYWCRLAKKFPNSKFVKSVASLCIPNFPVNNLPAVFIYYEDDLKIQLIGPAEFRQIHSKNYITEKELEWKLHNTGAIKSSMTKNPAPKFKIQGDGILMNKSKTADDSNEDDW